jgi:hypothetical protein
MGKTKVTQRGLVLEYYKSRVGESVPHAEMVDIVTAKYLALTGKPLRDPDRAARTLYDQGLLVKVDTGVYKYDPSFTSQDPENGFSSAVKQQIFEADGYKCRICGRSKVEGVVLHADHIKPRNKGGMGTFENGQTLCGECNVLKKNYGQLEFGKRLYQKYLDVALHSNDLPMIKFCEDILRVFERHQVN